MKTIAIATDKYGDGEATAVTKAFHDSIRKLVQQKLEESGGDWNAFVYHRNYDLITKADMEKVEADLLATGYKFEVSATISAVEEPEKYNDATGQDEFEIEAAAKDGKQLVGKGDNVVKFDENRIGIAQYVQTNEDVMDLMMNGVEEDTIAIIDDSGGTLTAPVLEHFSGVVCMGGTVRSHLGILSREYGIPCFMNSKVGGIQNGDRIEMNCTADIKTAEHYQQDVEMTADIWKHV